LIEENFDKDLNNRETIINTLRMDKKEIYVCKPWEYEEKRGKKYLLIWPDLPRWMVVDYELYVFLKILNGNKDINDVIEHLSKFFHKKVDIIEKQIYDISMKLIKYGIISKKGEERKTGFTIKGKIDNVSLNVTTRCNLNCKMCYNKFNNIPIEDELTATEIKDFLDQVMEFSEKHVLLNIGGGEPFIVPDKTLEVAEYATHLGFKDVWIITNGTLITREIARQINRLKLKIMVSLDGSNEKEHDFLRGKGNFKKTVRGIKLLKKEGVFVMTNFMCHKSNYKSLNAYYGLAKQLGVDSARFIPFKLMGGGLEGEIKKVPIDKLMDTAYEMFIHHPEYESLRGSDCFSVFAFECRRAVKQDWCGAGELTVLLDADGTIYPCPGHILPEFKCGNIRTQSFRDIWLNSQVLKNLREKYRINSYEKCSSCIVRYWCLWCRGETYNVTHDFRSSSIDCKSYKKAIIEMFWRLAEHPELVKGSGLRSL